MLNQDTMVEKMLKVMKLKKLTAPADIYELDTMKIHSTSLKICSKNDETGTTMVPVFSKLMLGRYFLLQICVNVEEPALGAC